MRLSVSLFLALIFNHVGLSKALFEWNCAMRFLTNYTANDHRDRNCFYTIPTTPIMELLEGTDEILNTSRPLQLPYTKQCVTAAIARGFPVAVLYNDKCYGGDRRDLFPQSVYNCYLSGSSCLQTQSHGYGCVKHLGVCKCGNGFGHSGYINMYDTASYHQIGLWLEVNDVFNRTKVMFDKSAPEYINLYKNLSTAFRDFVDDQKMCGVYWVMDKANTSVRPSKELGKIEFRVDFITSFPNLTHVLEGISMLTTNITNVNLTKVTTQLRHFSGVGGCDNYTYVRIIMDSGTTTLVNPTKYSRALPNNISFTIQTACRDFNQTVYHIKMARISETGEIEKLIEISNGTYTGVNNSNHQVNYTIEPFSLGSGVYYVEVKAWSADNTSSWNLTYRFINITKVPLEAGIEGNGTCLYTVGQPMIVHGWNSFDRDVYSSAMVARPFETDLNYIWTCHRSTESPSITISTVGSLRVVENGVPTGAIGGCFNTGYGRLKANTRSFIFQSDSIAAGSRLIFTLFVTKDFRNEKATKTCTVVPAPPPYNLLCVFNCGILMKTTARLGLEPSCNSIQGCPVDLHHSWKVYKDTGVRIDIGFGPNDTVWEEVTSYKKLTSGENFNFVLAENTLEQNKTYKIEHIVQNIKNGTFVSKHIFTTNRLPHAGKCTADKSDLLALVDTLTIDCKNWIDADPFLHYESWVHLPNGLAKLVYFGNASTFSLRLPLGDGDKNFSLTTEVKVFDYWESTSVFLNLTVTEPDISNPVDYLLDTLNNTNDDQEMAQKSLASLSLLSTNKTGNMSVMKKSKIRERVIGSMMSISSNGSQSINMVSGVLIESTAKSEELSMDSQIMSISSAVQMSETLAGVNNTDDPMVFDQAGETLLYLVGNVVDGAASKASPAGKSDNSQQIQEENEKVNSTKLKEVGQSAINATDSISKTLLGKMLGGERPKKFQTPSLGLEIAKTEADKLPESYNVNGGEVNVPSFMKSLVGNDTACPPNTSCDAADMFVSSKVTINKNSPYTWGNGSIKVSSAVISMDYSTRNGSSISVNGLDTDFELKIPTHAPQKQKSVPDYPHFVSPDKDCVNHKFFVDKDKTAFEVICSLAQEKYVTIYIRYGKRVTKTKYDYEYYHPDLSSCVEPPQRDNCTGIEDFMECMGLEFHDTGNTNLSLNETWKSFNRTNNNTNCENITIPDVSFLSNTSFQRDLPKCLDYHQIARCPPCPVVPVNGTHNNTKDDKGGLTSYNNASFEYPPGCGNNTFRFDNLTNTTRPVVCPKVQRFLDCKNRTVEQYEKCKPLLSKKKLIYNKYAKCHKNIYRRFIGIDTFNVTGYYYIAVCFNSTQWPPPTTPPPPPPTTTSMPTTTTLTTENRTANVSNTTEAPTKGKGRGKRSITLLHQLTYDNSDFDGGFDDHLNPSMEHHSDEGQEGHFYSDEQIIGSSDQIFHRRRRELSNTNTNNITNKNETMTTATPRRKCSQVEEKSPPTIPPIPTEFPPARPQLFNKSTSLNYSLEINTFCCLFRNESTNKWSTDGCRPHRSSSVTQLVCLCNHLTSFGSDLVVASNAIDLDDVAAGFANLGETGNFSVLFTIVGLFLLYAVLVVVCRRVDKRNLLLVSKQRIGSIMEKGFNYEVTVSTGTFRGSGTTSTVAMIMYGDKGNTQVIPLVDADGNSKEILSRGNVVNIIISTPEDLGDINCIRVWHNNKGKSPSWFLRQISVTEVSTGKKWLFLNNDWFALDKSDGMIDRNLYAASESDKTEFKTLFYSHTAKSFSDKHLWISVVLCPPASSFTCVQRITCCFSLLFTAMLANAMFYQNGAGDSDSIQIGPFKISLTQIIIGIQSGLIVAPVNLLIMTLFRKSRPKNKKMHQHDSKGRNTFGNDDNKAENTESSKDKDKKGKKEGFPYWVVYVAYVISALSVLASATVVLFYSMIWGTDKSNGWMVSVSLSLFQDILIVQPLKVFVLAMLLSLVFRKPPEEEVNNDSYQSTPKSEIDNKVSKSSAGSNVFHREIDLNPLSIEEVESARAYEVKRNIVKSSLKEIILHCIFVLLMSVILFGSQSSHRYQIHKHLSDVFSGSESITDAKQMWHWIENTFIPGLYQNKWYNGQTFLDERENFISDKRAVLISMPRMRQGRVKSENCEGTKDYPKLQNLFPTCYPHYSMTKADESPPSTLNNPQGSVKLNDSVLSGEIGFERMCLQPFIVQSASNLGTLPVVTSDATYSGSGMVADLGYDYATAREVVINLKEDRWISRQTRVVFVEFVVFEPTSLLYVFGRFTFEKQPTGAILSSHRIEPFALYGVGQSAFRTLLDIVQLALVIFIVVLFIRLILKLKKEKKLFFRDFWNIHQVFMLILALVLIALIFVRETYVRSLIKAIQENPYSRMSFDYVQSGTDVVNSIAAVVVFLATLKLLKLFNFNMKIQTFVHVIKLSKPFLVTYGLIFLVTFFAFAQMATFLFGQIIPMYSNIVRSFVNVFQMALGNGVYFHELKGIDHILGPLYIFTFFMITTLLLVNFFVAILNDGYVDGCESVASEENEDAIMAAFMSTFIKSSLRDISKELKAIPRQKRHISGSESESEGKKPRTKIKEPISNEAEYFLY